MVERVEIKVIVDVDEQGTARQQSAAAFGADHQLVLTELLILDGGLHVVLAAEVLAGIAVLLGSVFAKDRLSSVLLDGPGVGDLVVVLRSPGEHEPAGAAKHAEYQKQEKRCRHGGDQDEYGAAGD